MLLPTNLAVLTDASGWIQLSGRNRQAGKFPMAHRDLASAPRLVQGQVAVGPMLENAFLGVSVPKPPFSSWVERRGNLPLSAVGGRAAECHR